MSCDGSGECDFAPCPHEQGDEPCQHADQYVGDDQQFHCFRCGEWLGR